MHSNLYNFIMYMCTFTQYMYIYSNLTTSASDVVMTVQFVLAYCKGHAHIVRMTVKLCTITMVLSGHR